jgi:hypothetical protein
MNPPNPPIGFGLIRTVLTASNLIVSLSHCCTRRLLTSDKLLANRISSTTHCVVFFCAAIYPITLMENRFHDHNT